MSDPTPAEMEKAKADAAYQQGLMKGRQEAERAVKAATEELRSELAEVRAGREALIRERIADAVAEADKELEYLQANYNALKATDAEIHTALSKKHNAWWEERQAREKAETWSNRWKASAKFWWKDDLASLDHIATLRRERDAALAEVERLKADNADWEQSFGLYHEADMRGIVTDKSRLVAWLLGQWDALRKRVEELEAAVRLHGESAEEYKQYAGGEILKIRAKGDQARRAGAEEMRERAAQYHDRLAGDWAFHEQVRRGHEKHAAALRALPIDPPKDECSTCRTKAAGLPVPGYPHEEGCPLRRPDPPKAQEQKEEESK